MATSAPPIPPSAYSIVSWVRRGLGSFVTGQSETNFASLPVSLAINGAAVDAPPVRLLGPGDITGLDARAVIRTDPRDASDAFEPNYLAMAELALPDLPWMFSPSGDVNGRVRPWICLIVVPDGPGAAIQVQASGISVLRLDAPLDPRSELPDLTTIDLWAHAQVTGQALSGTALEAAFSGNSATTLARLIASRRLQPNQGYIACIVPTYHAGVNAALGLPVDPDDLAPAWDASITAPFVLPVYYQFRFRTGVDGDFASLAQKIQPPTAPVVAGTRPMDVSQPGFGMAPVQTGTAAAPVPVTTMDLGGALRTLSTQSGGTPPPPSDAQAAFAEALRTSLTPPAPSSTGDPVLGPPVYGSASSGSSLPPDATPPLWLSELNLNPESRIAASTGTQVVQKNQEALVAASWDQIGDLPKANRILRQAQMARQVSASLSNRHLQAVNGDGVFLQMTTPMHTRVKLAATSTLFGDIDSSRLPSGAVSAAMRRMARPLGPLGRQVGGGTTQIVDRLNQPASSGPDALQVAGPVLPPRGMVSLDAVGQSTSGKNPAVGGMQPPPTSAGWMPPSSAELSQQSADSTNPPAPLVNWDTNPDLPPILKTPRPSLPAPLVFPSTLADLAAMQQEFQTASAAINNYLQLAPAPLADPPPLGGGGSSPLVSVRTELQSRIDPNKTITARVGSRVQLGTGPDPLQPTRTGPQFPSTPMYTTLADLSPEWMLPGIASVPMDCATLLEPNTPFIESYMVGLNEELSRELLWRQYPVNPKSTYFQNFWGSSTSDIPPIQSFDPDGHLGSHVTARTSGSNIVLLIRANLFRRYPNAVVSAVKAQWTDDPQGTGKVRTLTATRIHPTFRGGIGSDVTFFGFAISDPLGVPDHTKGRPGWYFVIEEHLTEPRFGLEPSQVLKPQAPPVWNDLSWADLPGNFPDPALALPQREGVTWGADAASMAFILLREPVRVALHALALLGPPNLKVKP
jgi:hypothetical protein